MELVNVAVGNEAVVDMKLEGGKVILEVKYQGMDGFASLQAGIMPKLFLDKLAGMIPGQLDDMVIKALEAAMGM